MALYEFGPFKLDVEERSLHRNGQLIVIESRCLEVLAVLVRNNGRLVTKDQLMQQIWPETIVEDSNLTVCISKIRRLLRDRPARRKYIATLPRRGYSFVAAVTKLESNGIHSIAVLPFDNSKNNPNIDYLTDGLTESLIYRLSKLSSLRVTPRNSAFHYKGKKLDAVTVGRKLGVDWVLVGTIAVHGKHLSVGVELLKTRSHELMWGEQYRQNLCDLLSVEENLVREIIEKLSTHLGLETDMTKLPQRGTSNSEAYRYNLKGRFHLGKRTEEDLKKSIGYFAHAIELEPNCALSYAGMADAHNLLGFYCMRHPRDVFPYAKAEAMRALVLNAVLPEAYAALGFAKALYEWDWAGAEKCFLTSIQLGPYYVPARLFYGCLLVSIGRSTEAIEQFRHAVKVDPLSLIANAALGYGYYFAQRYDEAIEQCRIAIALNENFQTAHIWLGWCYQQKGWWEKACLAYERVVDLSLGRMDGLTELGIVYARSGKHAQARNILKQLAAIATKRYVSPYGLASIHVALGELEDAFDYLESAYADRCHLLLRLQTDPGMTVLHDDPRYLNLINRIGFPEASTSPRVA